MDVHPQILIFAGSLVTILALAGLAVLLRLGGTPALTTRAEAVRAADEVADGYEVADVALDANGNGALLSDPAGQIMIIKRHGNRFAGRILSARAGADYNGDQITVSSGETRFGAVTLSISDAAAWAEAINRLRTMSDA